MKQWFPLTDYDFYGYIACGFVVLFGIDYCLFDGSHLHKSWTVFEGSVLFALAYVTGQLIAMPSSMVLEHFFARHLLRPPAKILLSSSQGMCERWIGKFLIGRNYSPFPHGLREKITERASKDLKVTAAAIEADPENAFQSAFVVARRSEDTRKRMDDFRNQYGFNRNMAFAGFFVFALMMEKAWQHDDAHALTYGLLSLAMAAGMLLRFLKFYSSFAAEVFRAYAFNQEEKKQ